MKIDVSDVTIVGAGNLGTTLAFALRDAGIPVNEIVTRRQDKRLLRLAKSVGANLVDLREAELRSRVIWITTPDAFIAPTARAIARRTARHGRTALHGQSVLHSSGVLSSKALESTRSAGASIASVHPMMTFPKPGAGSLQDVTWAVEGDIPAVRVARRLVHSLGGRALGLTAKMKPLYHAFGTLSSPLLVSLLSGAEETGRASGLTSREARSLLRPIVERTLKNYWAKGTAASFSGPFQRGDVETIALHLKALQRQPEVLAVYRALAELAIQSLASKNRDALHQVLRIYELPASKPRRRASAKSVEN